MKLEKILSFEYWLYLHKNGNKNINYRKIVTSLYNGYPKRVVYWWTLKRGNFPWGSSP